MKFGVLIFFLIVTFLQLIKAGLPESVDLVPMFGTAGANNLNKPLGAEEIPTKRGSFLIWEWKGKILIAEPGKPEYSIREITRIKVDAGHDEKGLLGLAFSPNFKESRCYYLNYTYRRKTVIEERKMDPDFSSDAGFSRVIMEISQPYGNHNGGSLQFGPDGMLYIGTGDGGSGGDPENRAQNLKSYLGKILRIDVNGRKSGLNYAIPQDNPFVNNKAALPEIWAYGLRNPWKFSFDAESGDLWLGDVGQHFREEISKVRKGDNLGWRIKEGFGCFNWDGGNRSSWTKPLPFCKDEDLKQPVVELTREEGASVIGGYVYRKDKNSPFYGAYFYSDYYGKSIWVLMQKENTVSVKKEVARVNTPSSFARDLEGNIYVISRDKGIIYKLTHPQL